MPDDLTLRDAIREGIDYGYSLEDLEETLEAAGYDLDATAAEVADGRAWRRLTASEDYAEAESELGWVHAARVVDDGGDVENAVLSTSGPHPTLAAAVAALEADDVE